MSKALGRAAVSDVSDTNPLASRRQWLSGAACQSKLGSAERCCMDRELALLAGWEEDPSLL
jgi:hypothetical protein